MVGTTTLPYYYELNFALMQHHNYSMEDINNWLPFERDIFVNMLLKHIEKEQEEAKRK